MPLPPWISLELVESSLAAPAGTSRAERTGVRGRRLRLPPSHLVQRGDIVLTSPSRTWLDCAEFIPVTHLVAMGDDILHRELASHADLRDMVRWGRGRRGIAKARQAIDILDGAAESPGESLSRATLVLGGIPRPECNVDIFDDGQWIAQADMAWRRQRVIAEYDGIVHLPEEQRRKDAARRNLLTDNGWIQFVFTARDLAHGHQMCDLIASALRRHPSNRVGRRRPF